MSSSTPTTSQVPKSARIPEMPDLERLQKIKSSGGLLSRLDEQRLRLHQLRKLRRLWIRDQRLSAREPLHPPLTFRQKLYCREEAFWSKKLSVRSVADIIEGPTGSIKQFPLLMVYKFQKAVRNNVKYAILPLVPLLTMLYMHFERVPGNFVGGSASPVYPGDEYFTARRGDVVRDITNQNYYLKDEVPPGRNAI